MRRLRVLWMVAVALVVAACSGGSGGDGTSGAPGATMWRGVLPDGSVLQVELGVPPDDRRVAPFEALRALSGDEVIWLVGEIEVPADGAEASGRFVTLVEPGADVSDDDPFDVDDGVVSASLACSRLDGWWESAPVDSERDQLFEGLFAKTCGQQALQVPAGAGVSTRYVMVIDGADLPEYDRVFAGLDVPLEPVT
ncbi:MAG: hypothetical protein AAGA99_19230 [Actinomycetota bacterium]